MDYKYYEPPKELFDAVVNSSTYGSSKAGGPLWVMDFRIETLEKRFPDHPWIKKLQENEAELVEHGECWALIGSRFLVWVKEFIKKYGLCNILVLRNSFNKREWIQFYSLYSFCNLLCDVLQISRSEGAPLREISFILRDQSKQIKGDDYVWDITLMEQGKSFPDDKRRDQYGMFIATGFDEYPDSTFYWLPYPLPQDLTYQDGNPPDIFAGHIINRKFTQMGNSVVCEEKDWEIYFANIVYDCMELISMDYWGAKRFLQYPLMSFPVTKEGENPEKLSLPSVTNPALWHKEFFPKHYWIHKEFIPPRVW